MQTVLAGIVAILAILAINAPSRAQGVVFANSDPLVTIHSTFTGQTLTLFGNIEPGQGSVPEDGPYDVVILVYGPASDRIVRVKERQFSVMLNADEAVYRNLPGYYSVLSSRPLDQMLNPGAMADPRIGLASIAARARTSGDGDRFDPELIRMMTAAGLFAEGARQITFLSPTLFATRILLPSSVPNGAYLAQVLVIADGDVAGSSASSFSVRTQGFERFLARAATDFPALYGLAAVLVAVGTGWLGGVLFRR